MNRAEVNNCLLWRHNVQSRFLYTCGWWIKDLAAFKRRLFRVSLATTVLHAHVQSEENDLKFIKIMLLLDVV